jgi:sugar-specific transcriptional regulator TrmB
MTDPTGTLDRLGLTEYEQGALAELLALGQTTAPTLAESTGIPKARIYGVLDALSDRGFVEIIPGRPKEYRSRPPEEILDRATENHRQEYERFREDIEESHEAFLAEFEPQYERATEGTRTDELFSVVDVGEPSEAETRRLYRTAAEEVSVITTSFEYFSTVESALADALGRGIDVRVLMLHPEHVPGGERPVEEKREIQAAIVDQLSTSYPTVKIRFSTGKLPWRGTFCDPSIAYDSGEAILLVEENDVPNAVRQAATTENGSFVAGLKRYFDLIWEYESVAEYPLES